jgi:hypothetical protein
VENAIELELIENSMKMYGGKSMNEERVRSWVLSIQLGIGLSQVAKVPVNDYL